MIYYDGKWQPCTHIATFESRGQEQEKYINDKQRWIDMEKQHDHITNMEFEEFQLTDEQGKRLEQLNSVNFPVGFKSVARDFMETGEANLEELPQDYELPIGTFRLFLEQKEQDDTIDDALELIFEQEGLI